MKKQKTKKIKKKYRSTLIQVPIVNKFHLRPILNNLNYKNILLLRNYITVSGKILPKRLSHLKAKKQRVLSKAVKNARLMNFLPFVRPSFYFVPLENDTKKSSKKRKIKS